MKILFLTPRFPWPPLRGDRLTVINMLRSLSARHDVTLVSFVDGHEQPGAREQVSRWSARVVTIPLSRVRSWLQAWLGLFSPTPSQVSFYASASMRAEVERLLAERQFDVVLAHTIRMAPFVLALKHPCKILFQADSVGIALGLSVRFAPWWKRPGIRWERRRVDRYTVRCSHDFKETWVLSPIDRDDLVRIGCARAESVPHGVDESLFGLERRPAPEPRVMFLGNLSVPHNADAATFAARSVWPLVRREFPGGRLQIVGADPTAEVRRLATLPAVEVTGRVPDLAEFWRAAHVLLAPLRFSAGIQNKVLEAMAAGVPVVATPQVAAGIGAEDRAHLLVAESAEGLAAAVSETLTDPGAAAGRVVRAREHVRTHFSWDTMVRRMERLGADAPSGAST